MPEVKWIKIVTEFFDDEKIELIEAMPDADMILIIWIKLLTLAGKKNLNGYIFLTENIPYTDEMLATIFNRPINTVRLALEVFKKFEMIDYDGNKAIYITNWEKHQNIEGMERIRELNNKRAGNYRKRLMEAGGNDYLKYYQEIFIRDGGKCVYCGSNKNLCIDHLIALIKKGDNEKDNLVLSCKACNSGKSGKYLEETGYTFINQRTADQYEKVKERLGITLKITHNHATDKIRLDKSKIRLDKIRLEKKERDKYVKLIFKHWQKVMKYPGAKPSPERLAKIRTRMKEGFTYEQCIAAINGCAKSAYHMGKNDDGVIYDSIDLIFRNTSKLEGFIRRDKSKKLITTIEGKAKTDTYDWEGEGDYGKK